ncbi:GNAT family N-acetyltransferase [Leptospira gomenensis]|uniref:GNAT family N-acetyltransferase n=1 Tax=Leptospira gomenensis TaxID=2484974 RepID=A0A5F1Y7S5_9LEPT|nr:GNAT family N-acetyltransferase [Leptospira gomenensis]TGK31014.1 GNAT family N-acetyltransferase [Leptospira gomenensis]TGK43220.1 GNAT family N-acetyltransferase [Leptospira gomenensis]TGK45266.1 GNAT family N-acetyltransferase [Leptospira gomenensis]TGK66180.1 GNAT family N-acetyltransferase [Leptospira gomenensis]
MEFRFSTFAEILAEGSFSPADLDLDVWPEFINRDPVGNKFYPWLLREFPDLHCVAVTSSNEVAGTGKIFPFFWNGIEADLPRGWDAAILQADEDRSENRICNAVSAWAVEILPKFRGVGLSSLLLEELKRNAARRGFRELFACVRPNEKWKFPFLSLQEYLTRKREDGYSSDPWIRVHEKVGGKFVRVEERSMYIAGTVEEWERWTGMKFPASGEYPISEGLVPVKIDREKNLGEYSEPNVWFRHSLDKKTNLR